MFPEFPSVINKLKITGFRWIWGTDNTDHLGGQHPMCQEAFFKNNMPYLNWTKFILESVVMMFELLINRYKKSVVQALMIIISLTSQLCGGSISSACASCIITLKNVGCALVWVWIAFINACSATGR